MAFLIKSPGLDIGETPLENIFINTYMLSASEAQLKVYLLGLSMAKNRDERQNNYEIAATLKLSFKELREIWLYWKDKKIVDFKLPKEEDDIAFDVTFLSLRERYLSDNYLRKADLNEASEEKILYDENLRKFFEEAEELIRKPLGADERLKMISWLKDYNIALEMLHRAIRITYVERPPEKPGLKYVNGILAKWARQGVRTPEEAEEYERNYIKRADFYREVNNRLIGKTSLPTEAQIATIEEILVQLEDKSIFMDIVDLCSIDSSYPNYGRLKNLFVKLQREGMLSANGIRKYRSLRESGTKEFVQQVLSAKSRSKQNFHQTTYRSMSREDAIRTMKRKNPALNYNPKKEK